MTGQKKDMAGEDRLDAEHCRRIGIISRRIGLRLNWSPVNDHDVIHMPHDDVHPLLHAQ